MNYDNIINRVARDIPSSGIRKFFDVVAKMPDAISLGVGEPDFVTPWQFREDAIKSIQRGFTQYTSNAGIPELKQLIARYLQERNSLSYDATSEVLVTVGASEGIDLCLRTILTSGDEVLVIEPCFVSYAPCVELCGGVSVAVPCRVENEFKVMPCDIEAAITKKTKAIILSFPNNPTGAIMTAAELESIAAVLRKYPDILIISDEIYAELTYVGKHSSIAACEGMSDRTVVVSGFSKAFAMTGWRLGFLAGRKDLVKYMLKIHQYTIMCAPTASQYAGISALKNSFEDDFAVVEKMRVEYDRRRRFVVESFNDMGLNCFTPGGAFYVFPDVSATGLDGSEFAEQLLAAQKVAVVPGAAFGSSGKNFVRCSYAYSMKNLEQALGRIEKFVKDSGCICQ